MSRGPESAHQRPTISAVIPAFNAGRYIEDALESIQQQTYPVAECIVIDDGSTDDTADVVRRNASIARLIRQQNQGVSAARNRGAREATSDLLAFLDADDVWLPHKLECQVPLANDPDTHAVLCDATEVDAALTPLRSITTRPLPTRESLLLHTGTLSGVSSGILLRRIEFEATGGFDERLSTSADWDFLFRLLAQGPVTTVDEPLFLYRRHPGGMSRSVSAMEHDLTIAYRGAFEGSSDVRSLRRAAYARLHWLLGGSHWNSGSRRAAVNHVARAVVYEPRLLARLTVRAQSALTRKCRRDVQ